MKKSGKQKTVENPAVQAGGTNELAGLPADTSQHGLPTAIKQMEEPDNAAKPAFYNGAGTDLAPTRKKS
ncbi:MAG: hypothetical protein ACTHMI_21915 [Mucilaginibacter sp.]|uniref:hypothetical protein n=1 Tax=Mucilaginibacter sp. L3T2-6 TaxID=3062491 RepID=UPI0026755837|nr:hypothetical protein [Mucilaginibacter sp. L3T2-6]MDO3644203.1 hypothetical protein [Mucilaginibacter sp. L3T2-6]MDV6216700.1 hypothetical protein [Mucilaginibacter sp. L3T2-6]